MPSLKFNFILLSIGLLVTGCQMKPHSPTLDVLGSYFPAWIFCILLGLAMTLVARQLLIGFKLRPHLPPAPVLYVCLLIVFTLAVWLAFFKN
jgi:hypothetical protein